MAAVIGMTKSLGNELAQYDIAVNCISPATAQTRILEQLTAERIEYMHSRIPRGRLLEGRRGRDHGRLAHLQGEQLHHGLDLRSVGRADNLLERVALKTGSLLGDMHWSHTGMPHSAVRHAGSTACPADAGTPSMAGRQIDGA
ncbi:hypothetical protein X740_05870 [Mesorhizobium sp. LNHC221B00]|nr:hypothetical protein X740_05870 [Mesorhizobium sp. LNHC221B00]